MTFTQARWLAYLTTGWLVFFAVSHLLALGLTGPDGPWSHAVYVGYNLVLIAMSIAGAALVLATVRPWGGHLSRWLVLLPLAIGSVLLVVRGLPGIVEAVLMVAGIAPDGLFAAVDGMAQPASTGTDWTSIAINTYFFTGAVLLVPTTVSYARRSATARSRCSASRCRNGRAASAARRSSTTRLSG